MRSPPETKYLWGRMFFSGVIYTGRSNLHNLLIPGCVNVSCYCDVFLQKEKRIGQSPLVGFNGSFQAVLKKVVYKGHGMFGGWCI